MNLLKKALVIDGNSMFYRMYYATKNQVDIALNNNMTPNNAIKLMTKHILKFLDSNTYSYFFVAFDAHLPTFRHDELDSYKDKRDKTPDELYKQMNDFMKLLKFLGINAFSRDCIEADDLVGSFVKRMNEENVFVDVYSSDRDMLQLVTPLCSVHLMKTGLSLLEVYTNDNFADKCDNLSPRQIIDYKSIIGDQSDCLPGIKGVGHKTGITLLNKYNTLDNIYSNIDELGDKLKQKFLESKEMAYRCYWLATILTDQFDENSIDDFKLKSINLNSVEELADKYNLGELHNYINLKKLTGEY